MGEMGEMGEMERTGKKMGRGERREMMGETGEFEVTREVLDSPSEGSGRCSCLGSELAYTFPHICSSPPSLYPLIVCLLCPSRVSLHHLIVLPDTSKGCWKARREVF